MKRPIAVGCLAASIFFLGCGKGANLKDLRRSASPCDRLERIHDRTTACIGTPFACDSPSDTYVDCASDWNGEYCESLGFGAAPNEFTNCVARSVASRNNAVANNGFNNTQTTDNACYDACLQAEAATLDFCDAYPACQNLQYQQGGCSSRDLEHAQCARQYPDSFCRLGQDPVNPDDEPFARCIAGVDETASGCYAKCLEIVENFARFCPEVADSYPCSMELDENCSPGVISQADCMLAFPQGNCDFATGTPSREADDLRECLENAP